MTPGHHVRDTAHDGISLLGGGGSPWKRAARAETTAGCSSARGPGNGGWKGGRRQAAGNEALHQENMCVCECAHVGFVVVPKLWVCASRCVPKHLYVHMGCKRGSACCVHMHACSHWARQCNVPQQKEGGSPAHTVHHFCHPHTPAHTQPTRRSLVTVPGEAKDEMQVGLDPLLQQREAVSPGVHDARAPPGRSLSQGGGDSAVPGDSTEKPRESG